ncbi:MAG: peptidyl-prolyl cis-trans isomerase [Planctomycetes bacterium]|nr:peptidyl-prolyl cis-trans isomerase [Planctomycetota bacterium]
MDYRLFVGSLLLLGASLVAQNPPAATPPATKGEASQDPDKTQVTPRQQLDQLTAERERLEREIRYVQDRAKNAKSILAEKLAGPTATWRSIDAGSSAPKVVTPSAPKQRAARIGSKEELAAHGVDVMLLVNGRPVEQSWFESLRSYLDEAPGSATPEMRAQRAMFDLIRNEAVASAFEPHQADDVLGELLKELDGGLSWGDAAKKYGVVHGSAPDGKFELTRNSVFGSIFENAAFHAKEGVRARPFRNANGLVVMQVDKIEKGAKPELDKVLGTAIQIPYEGGAELLQKAQLAITTGQVDLVVRDETVLKMLPPMFQRPQTPPGLVPVTTDQAQPAAGGRPVSINPAQRNELIQKLESLQAQMQKLQGEATEEAKQQLEVLNKQYAAVKAQLRSAAPVAAPESQKPAEAKEEPKPR